MLVAIDGQHALFDQTGADAVGALVLFAPHRAGAESPGFEGETVARGPPTINWNAVAVGEQNATAAGADGLIQPIHGRSRGAQQRPNPPSDISEFRIGQPYRPPSSSRIEPMQSGRASPRGDDSGFCRLSGQDRGLDTRRMI